MKYTLLILFLSFISLRISAQDISIYNRHINDKLNIPETQWGMSSDEFQLLSRNFRMMDWFYGSIAPGYLHFKAKDYNMGYLLLSTRLLGYAGLGYVMLDSKNSFSNIINYNDNNYKYITQASIVLILSSYIFDMIHGNYRLKRKQELIRYKYGTKLQLMSTSNNVSSLNLNIEPQIPIVGISYSF